MSLLTLMVTFMLCIVTKHTICLIIIKVGSLKEIFEDYNTGFYEINWKNSLFRKVFKDGWGMVVKNNTFQFSSEFKKINFIKILFKKS